MSDDAGKNFAFRLLWRGVSSNSRNPHKFWPLSVFIMGLSMFRPATARIGQKKTSNPE